MFKRISIVTMFVLLFAMFAGSASAQQRDVFDSPRGWPDSTPGLQPIENDDDEDGDSGFGFGKKIAGSYYVNGSFTVTLPGQEPFTVPLKGLQTYGVHGTMVSTDGGSFNPTGGLQSPGHGTWIKSGPKSLVNNALIFAFSPDGELIFTAKPTGDWIFDDNTFQSGVLTFETCIFAPEQNPATEEPGFGCPTVGEADFYRINKAMD